VRHSENEFVDGDSGEQVGLAGKAWVRGIVELKEMLHLRLGKSEAREHGIAVFTELGRDEAVGVVLRDGRGGGKHGLWHFHYTRLEPAAARI
jgi:hypothetical protein